MVTHWCLLVMCVCMSMSVCVWVCVSVSEWTGSSVVQMMACCLFDTKPLHESLLNFFIWNHMINSSKMWIKIQIFSNAKYSIFCIRQYLYFDPHFARNSIWLKTLSAKWMPFSSNRTYYKQLPSDWLSILSEQTFETWFCSGENQIYGFYHANKLFELVLKMCSTNATLYLLNLLFVWYIFMPVFESLLANMQIVLTGVSIQCSLGLICLQAVHCTCYECIPWVHVSSSSALAFCSEPTLSCFAIEHLGLIQYKDTILSV